MSSTLEFRNIRNTDIAQVGGKNASLGEMFSILGAKGIRVPDGFAITAEAYRDFIRHNALEDRLAGLLGSLDRQTLSNLADIGRSCRQLVAAGQIPDQISTTIVDAYHTLAPDPSCSVAVRSSATAEDLPDASFAGQHDSFLNVQGDAPLLEAVRNCYVSLFNDRAIKYREDHGFSHLQVALSVGVQKMVRADTGSAGVAFTLDPETGNNNVIYLTSAWGLGENIVQGAVSPDEFYLFKQALGTRSRPLVHRRMGSKEQRMVYASEGLRPVRNIPTTPIERTSFSLSDEDAVTLGNWSLQIEQHYGQPMDIEWARDGITGELFIVQARPETVHSGQHELSLKEYKLLSRSEVLCSGKAVGRAIASGPVRIVQSLADAGKVCAGDVIVADITNPDWNALLRKAICIVTNKGGRTSHASIVARELGIHAVVGTGDATARLHDGQIITVSCIEGDEGQVYRDRLNWEVEEVPLEADVPTRTRAMLILADPARAFLQARYPCSGVGLLRMEFIINNSVRIHPMALVRFEELANRKDRETIAALTRHHPDRKQYFTETLAEAVALVAVAFYPREVIVRMSDFKTNEYAQLLGGQQFEPQEENPMLGFRGASRYYHDNYREGFALECEAMRVVRDEMGLTNVKLMIPFCRTLEEGQKVLQTMADYGLQRGKNGLEVYVMAEIPSNVILAAEFARLFDGFSIGSNDLTQLTLGIDRDSATISELFDENNPAVKSMLASVISAAKQAGVQIGLCGQAPSDHPEFARFLVELGIDSISFTADALLRGLSNIRSAESSQQVRPDDPVHP